MHCRDMCVAYRSASSLRKTTSLVLIAAAAAFCSERYARAADPVNPFAVMFVSSQSTNQVMLFNEVSGQFVTEAAASAPAASQIGYNGDMFLANAGGSDVLRFDGFTGAFKGIFVQPGAGGLVTPNAPNFGLLDDLVYVDDIGTNSMLRYDHEGNFIDVFATQASCGMIHPNMPTFDKTTMFLASGGTNSILRFDLATKAFLGAFVPPGSGGLVFPVGLEIGPDQNIYASSNGTSSVMRYDGKTGAFIDVFVPPNAGGMCDIRALRFGGPNSDLYVVSACNNQVVEFDRETGAFVKVASDGTAEGMAGGRGLTFSPRPILHVYPTVVTNSFDGSDDDGVDASSALSPAAASPDSDRDGSHCHRFRHISVDKILKDYSDDHPKARLESIVSTDPNVDIRHAVRHADFGEADFEFDLAFCNDTGVNQQYKMTYTATNNHKLTTISTALVDVPPQ